MRIKHFAGYGTVTAKKVSDHIRCDGQRELVIKVTGNHEWGLFRDNTYDLFNWLVKRFDKNLSDDSSIIRFFAIEDNEVIDGVNTDTCTYHFFIKEEK